MSCGAVVITLDAAPMNELVTAERGVLAPAQPRGKQGLATTWDMVPETFAAAIELCVALSIEQREAIGCQARQWFLQRQPALLSAAAHCLTQLEK